MNTSQFAIRTSSSRDGKLLKRSSTRKPQRSRRHCQVGLESLEQRLVLTWPTVGYVLSGTKDTLLSGTVFDDLDANGALTPGENGIQDWTVYLDLDHSGTLNTDSEGVLEPSAITDKDGFFQFDHLRPGTYRLTEVVPSRWTPTVPESKDVAVTLNKESTSDFFNFGGGDIVGTIWNDVNNDGIRDTDPVTGAFTDPGLEGWTVYVDLNKNNMLDPGDRTTLTDGNGAYSFSGLAAGDYKVGEVLPDGWDVTIGFDAVMDVAVFAVTESSQDFGNFSTVSGSVSGVIWNDLNNDGVRATDPVTGEFLEPGLEGWTVFADLDGNGSLDPGEPSTVTNSRGEYNFVSLVGDTSYQITEVLPEKWYPSPGFDSVQTVDVFAGENTVVGDFANFTVLNGSIRGTVWSDLNRNGVRDTNVAGDFTDPGLQDWTVFIDLNRNLTLDAGEPSALTDVNGGYFFGDLQVGDYEVREILPTGWEVTKYFSDNQTVTVHSGIETPGADFANFNLSTIVPGSISGVVFNDLNGNGVRDVSGTGTFTDPGLSGWTVFLDLNGNGIFDGVDTKATTAGDGSYTLTNVSPGTVSVVEVPVAGFRATAPVSRLHTISLTNGENATGLDFGNQGPTDSSISGIVFADTNKDGKQQPGELGIAGALVYLDLNNSEGFDPSEPFVLTASDQFYTPTLDESGTYSFTHLSPGSYTVRVILPTIFSATPATELVHSFSLTAGQAHLNVDTAAVYRPTEVHGVDFEDLDGDHVQDPGEPAVEGATVFVDLNRNDVLDAGEPSAITKADGSYAFSGLGSGGYVVREVVRAGYERTYPQTTGGTLWPQGTSNPAVGNVTPTSITTSLASGASYHQTVSITLPNTGALTNLVDVFLLFDDTGSFTNNSPIVRAAFPAIIAQLQAALPGTDLGFGVGRFEEYGNFAYEYSSGRPFTLNQPIVAASTDGYMTSIQAALNRTTPGYGGDGPETDIEALYQLVTGLGFDGNNNGSVLDSGAAGLVSTQLNPGASGDVPSFASFTADASGSVMQAAGTIGGAGFRAGALPIILTATDIGFAYQPKGETTIVGVGGVSLPVGAFTQTSRPTTPFNYGAGIQETITGLNALGALVIGLGTNTQTTIDPRQGLEALSKLTGAVNRSTTPIDNGTGTPIAPGDPLYFQISSGFASSVANGVANAIQNAATNVAVDITVQASDPRVKIVNHSGVRAGIGSGQTASFDIEFVGDGIPSRFDLQFVRAGTNVVLGSIPVVLGTPIPGDGYEFEDLAEGEIASALNFGSRLSANSAPTDLTISNASVPENRPSGTPVGTIAATDPDAGDTITYGLVAGAGDTDNASFSVAGDQLLTASGFNFEAKASYSVRLKATDSGGLSFEKALTITVANVNEITGLKVQRNATQRSFVRYVDLLFEDNSGLGSIISGGRIGLTRYDLDGNSGVSVPLISGVLSTAGNTIGLDFGTNGIGGNRLTSQGDGYYVLSIDQDGDGTPDATRAFYRLLGDVNGDRTVDLTDSNLILAAYGQIGINLNSDITGDGVVNAQDRTIAIRQRGRKLKSSLRLDG